MALLGKGKRPYPSMTCMMATDQHCGMGAGGAVCNHGEDMRWAFFLPEPDWAPLMREGGSVWNTRGKSSGACGRHMEVAQRLPKNSRRLPTSSTQGIRWLWYALTLHAHGASVSDQTVVSSHKAPTHPEPFPTSSRLPKNRSQNRCKFTHGSQKPLVPSKKKELIFFFFFQEPTVFGNRM